MIVRHPLVHEVETMLYLFEDEVRAGRMLPRSAEKVRAHLHDWLVIEKDGDVVGCVSLVYFNGTLCEIRSLAVHRDYRGNGIARILVDAAVEMARQRGMKQVLTLTRAAGLFQKAGFELDQIDNFPEKVRADCAPCPFRHACDEVALLYVINQEANHAG